MLTSFPQITTYWCQNSFRGCWSYLRGGRRLLWSCIHTVTPRRIPQWRHPAKYTVHHTEFWCALCSSMSVTLLIQDLRLHMAFLLFTASHSLLCPAVKKKQKEAIGQWQGIQWGLQLLKDPSGGIWVKEGYTIMNFNTFTTTGRKPNTQLWYEMRQRAKSKGKEEEEKIIKRQRAVSCAVERHVREYMSMRSGCN